MEEVNSEAINNILKQIPDSLSPIERLVLCNEGTVQTLLSVLFKTPIKVEILHQEIIANNTIARWSKLTTHNTTICLAHSIIESDDKGFMVGIEEKKMGIGQLISAKKLITKRTIKNLYADNNIFSRIYEIESIEDTTNCTHIKCLITEVFPKSEFLT